MYSRDISLTYDSIIVKTRDFQLFWAAISKEIDHRMKSVKPNEASLPHWSQFVKGMPLHGTLEPGSALTGKYIDLQTYQKSFLSYECTDPRDKVFGFYGCFPPTVRERIVIDHTKSSSDVFRCMTEIIIETKSDLRILNAVTYRPELTSHPSWVPNYEPRKRITSFYNDSSPKPDIPAPFEIVRGSNNLRVRGACIGEVRKVAADKHYELPKNFAVEKSTDLLVLTLLEYANFC